MGTSLGLEVGPVWDQKWAQFRTRSGYQIWHLLLGKQLGAKKRDQNWAQFGARSEPNLGPEVGTNLEPEAGTNLGLEVGTNFGTRSGHTGFVKNGAQICENPSAGTNSASAAVLWRRSHGGGSAAAAPRRRSCGGCTFQLCGGPQARFFPPKGSMM